MMPKRRRRRGTRREGQDEQPAKICHRFIINQEMWRQPNLKVSWPNMKCVDLMRNPKNHVQTMLTWAIMPHAMRLVGRFSKRKRQIYTSRVMITIHRITWGTSSWIETFNFLWELRFCLPLLSSLCTPLPTRPNNINLKGQKKVKGCTCSPIQKY